MTVLRGTDACFPSPGPFNTVYAGDTPVGGSWGHFLAFWSSTITAAFSFLGTEIVAVTAGEAANPRKTMPGAIRRVFWRLLMFYVLGVRPSPLGVFQR
jgi:amino acid transporter